eukprot:4673359-Pyramimonas_sp.AAC.1
MHISVVCSFKQARARVRQAAPLTRLKRAARGALGKCPKVHMERVQKCTCEVSKSAHGKCPKVYLEAAKLRAAPNERRSVALTSRPRTPHPRSSWIATRDRSAAALGPEEALSTTTTFGNTGNIQMSIS